MRRRALLALVASLAGGCLSAGRTRTPTGASEGLPPTGDGAALGFDAGDPFARRAVGNAAAADSHRIAVWNDDADRRPIRVRVREVGGPEPAVSATPTFPAYGTFSVTVFRPADYVLEVRAPDGPGRELGVRRGFVDCDDSATHVAVRPDGSVRARVVSTGLGCDAEQEPEPE
ncbi:hypothetical protein GCM10008995_05600 [Halobellus salinus]|uniref:Uncharacterized protein n=1 Tax=Halobellus salinus TaxID=931585 RepID=A0A830E842_9EURY|nr:hypothetical protein [Halobellus salinus]GGI98601.1 hypothetical protein GCM10008995_05600 [Halobellus salinus]SMP05727.1 hypothetical protein SAMN06265347_102117 [Halobellus salinus]